MGALTEAEIFDCLADNFGKAAQLSEDLAKLPKKGVSYQNFRAALKLIEGAARQAAYWRQDARWLKIGLYMEECHKRAGDWLRGYKLPSGLRITHKEGTLHPLFMNLAENLRKGQAAAEQLRTKKTGRMGVILPNTMAAPHRDTRLVGWTPGERRSRGGLILPAGAGA